MSGPSLLLLDEPLAAVDVPLRRRILPYLQRVRDELTVPIVYVSHDREEVDQLADEVVLMDNGRVVRRENRSLCFAEGCRVLLRHLFAIAVLPFTVAVIVPVWLARQMDGTVAIGSGLALLVQIVGVAVGCAGLLLFVASPPARRQRPGTLTPWDHPGISSSRGPTATSETP